MAKNTAHESVAQKPTQERANAAPDHDVVEELAYQLWILRARPIGSPEVDWYRAEQEFRNSMK
jgi:hypothetical protein